MKQLDWYEWKAMEFNKKTAPYISSIDKDNGKILEIGSEPIGIYN